MSLGRVDVAIMSSLIPYNDGTYFQKDEDGTYIIEPRQKRYVTMIQQLNDDRWRILGWV